MIVVIARTVIAFLVGFTAAAHANDRPHRDCASMQGVKVPASDIGLPTGGATVNTVKPSDHNALCSVIGAIAAVDPQAPSIRFQINLPSNWNEKAVHLGGGGFNGVLVDGLTVHVIASENNPVKRGFVTFGSDSGHEAKAPLDGSFARNDEAMRNFAGDQLKKVHDVAVQLVREYYGKRPRRLYFYGISEGGREALIVAQRQPADYDGIISFMPSYSWGAFFMGTAALVQRLYGSQGAWLSPNKTTLIGNSVLKACDELDGLADGIVANVAGCRRSFHIQTLRCPTGTDEGEGCLSDAQIATAEFMAHKVPLGFEVSGISELAPWPLYEGAFTPGTSSVFGEQAVPARPPGDKDALALRAGDQVVREMILHDPEFDTLKFRPQEHLPAVRRFAKMMDATEDLDAFKRRGGKLLLMHGTIDMAISPHNTVAYYERLKSRYGARLKDFTRLYLAPGVGHLDGPFRMTWDSLSTLDRWVDVGELPSEQVMVDQFPDHDKRARPLCEYPAWPQYRGTGDPKNATSFFCVNE